MGVKRDILQGLRQSNSSNGRRQRKKIEGTLTAHTAVPDSMRPHSLSTLQDGDHVSGTGTG